jgi:hypothetical protein
MIKIYIDRRIKENDDGLAQWYRTMGKETVNYPDK